MTATNHLTHVYVGLAGEGDFIGGGGLYRRAEGEDQWVSVTNGLPEKPQVRSLLVHPENPNIVYAGTHEGPYRSDDRGDHWEPLDSLEARRLVPGLPPRMTPTQYSPDTSPARCTALRTVALTGRP